MSDQVQPEISVIIPCKNHSRELYDCLSGCSRMKFQIPFEIIVVDSASDPKVESTVHLFAGIKLIRSKNNLNAASARNLGAARARGRFLAFIDADCFPDLGWLQAAAQGLRNGLKMVGGPVSDATPFRPVAGVDNILQFADLPDKRPISEIEFLPGCNIGVPKEVFETMGGFPVLPIIEDVLFTTKVAARWPDQCKFLPDMIVFHKGRQSLAELWKHHRFFGYQRGFWGFRITKKQQDMGRFWHAIPLVVLLRLNYIFRSILRWNPQKTATYVALLPLILYGLTGYAIGFRRGCQSSHKKV